ncbi:hypothetical protein GCM10010238_11130 [Streptomyces griseoviridis]|uniref:Tc1-like transposase DDE domain-containing protein n=1 Tax=Streptomyces griseoviridis TaxID=45398 RepID=A0A918L9V1_STRGD|nr:hypothetical protein GCM10010238_11130 [Streptomyces niveoruber]
MRRAVRSPRPASAGRWRSQSAVSRIRRAFALAPHRSQTFKLSTDPLYIDKVRDVVGLCLDPPEKALVLCVDEKSQIQALDRSQPVLPMMPGVPERRSHDYVRAGTTTLFAALEAATGKVIGSLHRRHRAAEFKKFLAELDKEVPAGLQVHLILDNYATHKTPDIKKWLPAHSRFHLHFTPTSASWLNLVERWFAEPTQKKLKRGVHRSVLDEDEARIATSALDDASDLATTYGRDWPEETAPRLVKTLVLKSAARCMRDPEGYTQSRAGDETPTR